MKNNYIISKNSKANISLLQLAGYSPLKSLSKGSFLVIDVLKKSFWQTDTKGIILCKNIATKLNYNFVIPIDKQKKPTLPSDRL